MEVTKYLNGAGVKTLWGQINEYFARKAQLAELQEQVDSLSQNGVVVDNKTIKKGENGLETNLILNIDTKTNKLQLIAKDIENGVINEVQLPSLEDSFLESISIVTVPSENNPEIEGRPAGTYIKFEFNTASGKTPIYLSIEELGIEVYEGSDYIEIVDGKISIKTTELDTWLNSENCTTISSIKTSITNINDNISDLSGQLTTLNGEFNTLKEQFNAAVEANFYHEALTDEEITNVIKEFEDTQNVV